MNFNSGYMEVNGLRMYYEAHGEGRPLVLIHGGGSTMHTSFGRIIPLLAKNRQVIAVDMQAHGRTGDRDTGLSFTQDADDIAALLEKLNIRKAAVLGFSNGGQTAIEIGLRHTAKLNKLIICSAFYKRSAAPPQFWEGFEEGRVDFSQMPQPYKDAFLEVNNDEKALHNMFRRDVERMRSFQGWTEAQLQSIQTPTLIVNGNQDVATPEHAVEMYRLIPNAQLIILPGGHGTYMGELFAADRLGKEYCCFVKMIEEFLAGS